MEIKTTEEYVVNKLIETENTLKSTQEELLKAKETLKKLKEGIDIIAERVSLHKIYLQSQNKDSIYVEFNNIWDDNPVYNTILDVLRTSEKFDDVIQTVYGAPCDEDEEDA